MKILVTGANGFIGKNLMAELQNQGFNDILAYDRSGGPTLLDKYTEVCDFVFHLAGVNRPEKETEFMAGNYGFTAELLKSLKKHGNKAPIVLTSSVQATLDNPYGQSKRASEDLVFRYKQEMNIPVYVYRLPNVFGKWCRPDYNSVVATFCHNIANIYPIRIHNPEKRMDLVYIDDVVNSFIDKLKNRISGTDCLSGFEDITPVYTMKISDIALLLYQFTESRYDLFIPDMSNDFTRKLYATFLSYLPEDQLSYRLKTNHDSRGSFSEFLKTNDRGQVSINVVKPHAVKGNHWHHTKNEKFLTVSGNGVVRLRKPDSDHVITFTVSGDQPEVIDIPPGYIHNIENTGDVDMVTVIWVNEVFDKNKPDTYYSEVELTLKKQENEEVKSNDSCRHAS